MSTDSEFMPGEWYFLITCVNCQKRLSLFHDLSRGKSKIKAIYKWTCPACNHTSEYDTDSLERYRHPDAIAVRSASQNQSNGPD
jgi:hypothetical protein